MQMTDLANNLYELNHNKIKDFSSFRQISSRETIVMNSLASMIFFSYKKNESEIPCCQVLFSNRNIFLIVSGGLPVFSDILVATTGNTAVSKGFETIVLSMSMNNIVFLFFTMIGHCRIWATFATCSWMGLYRRCIPH